MARRIPSVRPGRYGAFTYAAEQKSSPASPANWNTFILVTSLALNCGILNCKY